jgi:hypothetical protein
VSATTVSSKVEAEPRPDGRPRWKPSATTTGLLGIVGAAAIILICARPMLWGRNFTGFDWYVNLWYVWHQAESLQTNGFPSLFVHNNQGLFEPHFAFYGGTLYTLAGVLTLATGSHEVAFALTWLIGFAVAYGGWYWLARQAGLGVWPSHAPGILFVTSPWYLASIFALGSWGQTIAMSTVPMLLASAVAILRADRLRPLPVVALATSTIVFTGSHNLTMLWATTVLLLVGIVLLVVVPTFRKILTRRGLLRLALIVVPAIFVNAWFLLPDIAYQAQTAIAQDTSTARGLVSTADELVDSEHVLSLSRKPATTLLAHFALQLPLLATGWLVIALIAFRPRWRSPWLRTALVMVATMIAIWILFTHSSLILSLPSPWRFVQAGYRLEGYIQLALAGGVIACLIVGTHVSGRRRWWMWALLPVLVVSVIQARGQVGGPEILGGDTAALPTPSPLPYRTDDFVYGSKDYVDGKLAVYTTSPNVPLIRFSPETAERSNWVTAVVPAKPGQYLQTNVRAATALLQVSGAHVVGRDPTGNTILQIDRRAKPGPARISVRAASPWPVAVGRLLSIAGLLGLAAIFGTIAVGAARRRRAPTP